MLREAPGLGDEDKRLCDIISGEAARLNNLVSDMMDLARPRKPEPEDVDVAALAREVVELAARSERSGSGDVAVRYVGPDRAVLARCDGAQMRQVVWNLVRNAVQASAAGQAVVVRVGEEGDRVSLSVSDEGPGIDPSSTANIFDAFYTTRSHGAGIGLAVVRRIVDDHATMGASIQVRSTTQDKGGVGATFEVGLARSRSPGTKDATRASTPPDPGAIPAPNGRSR
jgi:signal transduction histidine kinase